MKDGGRDFPVRSLSPAKLTHFAHAAARSGNALMTAGYWQIGAAYGADLIKRLGLDLSHQFGRGFG